MRIQIERPTKPVNSAVFYKETGGYDLICIADEFFLQGETTEAELLAAYDNHNPEA